ncbi:MAG: hypothetical protein H0T45_02315 [Pyrinomonadaceae bacterium]|nr:hypothetical protein [Pyrinomonadaceae bacterium]
MSDPNSKDEAHAEVTAAAARDLDFAQARLAYRIIQSLLEHTRVTGDLVALMAQTLDEDTTKALTNTPYWAAYLDSRRALERTRQDVEKFSEMMTRLAEDSEM